MTNEARPRHPAPQRRPGPGVPRIVLTALGVFLLALLLVTGAELVIGHPMSGGPVGETTMTALFLDPSS
ncbi:hypothetical protein [Actinomycetospora sp. TBRC 11914]|uniref:hypothetical protein n=1 Tax=Actinomycetospora sp. TBRC 11914 TaxID=2729387 RepID=UPI00145D3EB6|nr:hypothetical protein [Actinomycetospora sp. TBRC 11914]NMO89476.1 hypothetical protein [Actinomycetospora sp. TBRC 11914]